MRLGKPFILSGLIVAGLAAWFSWPLPRFFTEGIPSSARNQEAFPWRRMIPGDHLQLHYQFWLVSDMLAGRTPWFHNVYEFNTGDDAERFRPHHHFVPFSLLYAVLSRGVARAAAWNLATLAALWLIFAATWRWLARVTGRDGLAAALALASLLFPYLWSQLFGGSPTGFAAAWIPVTYLGLWRALIDKSWAGGVLAGFGILFANLGDTQTYYFLMLSLPVWVLVMALYVPNRDAWRWTELRRALVRLAPTAALAALGLVFAWYRKRHMDITVVAHGRDWREAVLFSPALADLLSWPIGPFGSPLYLGGVLLGLILVSTAAWILGQRRRPDPWPRRLAVILILAFTAGALALALGAEGPFGGRLFAWMRRVVPQYNKIRQPTKILVLVMYWLPLAAAVTVPALLDRLRRPRAAGLAVAALAALLILDYRLPASITVCLLDDRQAAYAAAAEDPVYAGAPPRAVVIPFWPGDSAWSSLYEHYASLYRLRLLNGYSPAAQRVYVEDIYPHFRSLNQGLLDDAQVEDLLARGIRHVLFHEDAFPEKVSPFSSFTTLQRLLRHARLERVAQDGSVWCFRLTERPVPAKSSFEPEEGFFPARCFELERGGLGGALAIRDASAGDDRLLRLQGPGHRALTDAIRVGPAPALRWMLRCRGSGVVRVNTEVDGETRKSNDLSVESDAWRWRDVPLPEWEGLPPVRLRITHQAGSVDVDQALLAAGIWSPPEAGQAVEWLAAFFFHAGWTRVEAGTVTLRRDYDPAGAVFYGPLWPLEAGRYEVSLIFTSSAPAGAVLGEWYGVAGATRSVRVPVVAGQPAGFTFSPEENFPARFNFAFSRAADVTIERVRLQRVE
jgi:hypothetical protein